MEILQKNQENLDVRQINPEQCEDRIVFMLMFNDIDCTQKGTSTECFSKSEKVNDYAKRCPHGHWSFLGPGEETNGMERTLTNESAGFMGRVSIGMHYKTIHDLNDGFVGRTGAYPEDTLLREDPESEIIGWIDGHTKIGPVFQVKSTCYLDIYGIEIQILST